MRATLSRSSLSLLLLLSVLHGAACQGQRTVEVQSAILSLPSTWSKVIVRDSDGTATLFPHGPSKGNLWVSTLIARTGHPITHAEARGFLERSEIARGGSILALTDSSAVLVRQADTVEDGSPLVIRQWEVIHAAPPNLLYTAILSYARSPGEASTPADTMTLSDIDSVVAHLRFRPYTP